MTGNGLGFAPSWRGREGLKAAEKPMPPVRGESHMKRHASGFTLIELLIVVAIIAILAAIAVPNFLEAQTRSKISRAKADIRTMATALEAYRIDHNVYPIDGFHTDMSPFWYVPNAISTPVAYITSADLFDPFRSSESASAARQLDSPDGNDYTDMAYTRFRYLNYLYTYRDNTSAALTNRANYTRVYGQWRLNSAGPDRRYSTTTLINGVNQNVIYDATNGTVSEGDILRSQLEPDVRYH